MRGDQMAQLSLAIARMDGWRFNKSKSGEKIQEIPYSTVKSREDGRNVKTSGVQCACWKKYHVLYIIQDILYIQQDVL